MYNMDGPRGYYSKWNKPDRERQIKKKFYDKRKKKTNILWFHVMYTLKKSNEQIYQNQTITGTEIK